MGLKTLVSYINMSLYSLSSPRPHPTKMTHNVERIVHVFFWSTKDDHSNLVFGQM